MSVYKSTVQKEINPKEVLDREYEICKLDPTTIIRLGYLKIKNKAGELVPLVPNEIQSKVLKIIRDLRVQKKPVRLFILKGRQFGISTLMESLVYCFSSMRPNLNCLIMADDDDGSNYLFEMTKLYHEIMLKEQPHLTPMRKISNEKKLEFMHKRSQILIDTAQNVDAGRKYTFQIAHLSEVSRFRDFDQSFQSLMQSVPDLPGTFVFMETTARGENASCEFWRNIKEKHERGETDWVPIFLSWKDHGEYTRQFFTESEKNHFVETMNEDEKYTMATHGLTLEQMNWRRYTIENKCGGKLNDFHQEYPLTDTEAFLTTGKRVYPDVYTKPQEKNICEPKYIGEVEWINSRAQFIPAGDGHVRIFKTPQKGHRYVIAVDASDGVQGGDPACIQVLDRSTWEQVAVCHGIIPPDVLGQKAYNLGAWYNWALVAPETNQSGMVTTLKLRDLFYPNIVHRTKLNIENGVVAESDELGWQTNVKTKPVIVHDLGEALREILIVIHDKKTLDEIKGYQILEIKESGSTSYGSSKGQHDDRVMALAIAVHQAKKMPDFQETTVQEQEIHSQKVTGY